MFTRTLTRYVLKELLTHSLSAAAIVIVLSCVRRLGTYLTDAAGGVLPFDAVLQLVGIRTVIALPSLLPAGVYVGILLGLRRLATDRELTALEASGVRPLRVAAVVMLFAFLSAVLVCVLALAVRPRAARTFDRIASVVHFTGLQPGRFYEFAGEDDLVIRAGAKAADGSMEEVFLQRREHGRVSIASCSAATEHIDRISGFRFLTLRDGYLYEFGSNPKLGPHSITDYRELIIRLPLRQPGAEGWRQGARLTGELLGSGDPADAAELQWRLTMPVSTLVLALTAVALPRDRAGARGLLLGIVAYVAYGQSLNIVKSWVENGQWATFPGMWTVHALWLLGVSLALRRSRLAADLAPA